jgi:hypothetical protein
MNIAIPCSIGELVDKVTILEIKAKKIKSHDKLKNVLAELDALTMVMGKAGLVNEEFLKLKRELSDVNHALWVIEDDIRDKERKKEFDRVFIELARSVYFENDRRSRIKRKINLSYGSAYVEEKSYEAY